MSGSDLAKLMPETELKTLIVSECTRCHTLSRIGVIGRSPDQWRATIEKMRHNPYNKTMRADEEDGANLTDEQATKIVDYLAKNFGPGLAWDSERDFPKAWIRGDASKYMITEYDLPSGSEPHDLAVDSKGIGWVGEDAHGVIGRFDPQTLAYTRISIPQAAGVAKKPQPHGVAVGPQDRVWVTDHSAGRIVQYDPETQQFTFYPIPKPSKGKPTVNTMAFKPDGTVWMTESGADQILRLNLATKTFDEFPVPTSVRAQIKVDPYGMAVDGAGWLWFAEENWTNKVGRVAPKSGEITEYSVPVPEQRPKLKRMASDVDGNIWFASWGEDHKLVKVDYRTTKMATFPTPTKYSGTYSVDVDRKRNLIWVSEYVADQLARFDPRTNRYVEYPLFGRGNLIRKIAVDPSGRVWFSGSKVDRIGYLDVIE